MVRRLRTPSPFVSFQFWLRTRLCKTTTFCKETSRSEMKLPILQGNERSVGPWLEIQQKKHESHKDEQDSDEGEPVQQGRPGVRSQPRPRRGKIKIGVVVESEEHTSELQS